MKTGRTTTTLEVVRLAALDREAKRQGLNLPLFCRLELGKIADELLKKEATR